MQSILWLSGWLVAFGALCRFGFQLALKPRPADRLRLIKLAVFALSTGVVALLAQFAVFQHDQHFDATSHKALTADKATRDLVDSLRESVKITYFGHDADPRVRRLITVLETLARRSKFLEVKATDPDKDPVLARRYNVNLYNVAVVEAGERRLLVRSTNEIDLGLAIQKALRQKVVSVCFVEGHGEAEIYNEEFHTHMESFGGSDVSDGHHHGHAHIPIVQSTAHGIGRLRQSLEAIGYEPRLVNLTTESERLPACDVVSVVQPRYPFTADEIARLQRYHESGTSVLAFIDIGYELGEMGKFFAKHGVKLEDTILVDQKQHHETDAQSIAISAYPVHPVTKQIAMAIFPGARSLVMEKEIQFAPLVTGNKTSEKYFLHHHHEGDIAPSLQRTEQATTPEPPIIAVAKDEDAQSGKLVVFGEADFLTNSYFPYLSNNALALSIFRWAADEQEAVATKPIVPVFQRIVLTREDMNKLFFGLVVGLPGLILLIGAGVWLSRR